MIPRSIHHIWLGPREVPAWPDAWRARHPGWDVRVWREADLDGIPMANRDAYDRFMAAGLWHGASDIARVAVLDAVGGVYVDIDSKPLRSFDGAPFMAADFFAGYEPTPSLPGRLANGTIGAVAGHPILATYAELVGKMESLEEPWDTCGGTGLTAAVLVHRQCCHPLILPARTFYATDSAGRPTAGGHDAPYSEHFWATTNVMYPLRVAIMVPRRAGDPARDRAWEFVRRHWSAIGWPIVEGHHDEGPFNASAARNAAAGAADTPEGRWDVAVFVDGDSVMFDLERVRAGVMVAAKSGIMVRPFSRYWILDAPASERLMATGAPIRGQGARQLASGVHGGVNIVPRRLFDAVGGYDERFAGWGSEDTAFELACRSLGGFRALIGDVYHLWHPIGADRNTSLPGFIANVALRARYEAVRRPETMRALLAERTGAPVAPPAVGAVVITDGRRDCIARTIPSLEAAVGPFTDRLICDDSGDPDYAAWLRSSFPGWRVEAHRRLGHGPAVRFAIEAAAKLDADWVFWSEDDVEYLERVDVASMAAVLTAEPDLKQLVLKRQAWFPAEIEAGGMIERFDPSLFTERLDGPLPWIEHRQFYSLNPHLARRALVEVIRWPAVPNSEHVFSRRLFGNRLARSGIVGRKADAPLVRHFGEERVGVGY